MVRVCTRGGPEVSVGHNKRNRKQSSLSTLIPADFYIRKISELNVTSADLSVTFPELNVESAGLKGQYRGSDRRVRATERSVPRK
jgi:hypothetical protein